MKKHRDNKYVKWVCEHSCVICGDSRVHPHHLRQQGLTRRNNDECIIPLCFPCHRHLHDHPEKEREIETELKDYAKRFRENYLTISND